MQQEVPYPGPAPYSTSLIILFCTREVYPSANPFMYDLRQSSPPPPMILESPTKEKEPNQIHNIFVYKRGVDFRSQNLNQVCLPLTLCQYKPTPPHSPPLIPLLRPAVVSLYALVRYCAGQYYIVQYARQVCSHSTIQQRVTSYDSFTHPGLLIYTIILFPHTTLFSSLFLSYPASTNCRAQGNSPASTPSRELQWPCPFLWDYI